MAVTTEQFSRVEDRLNQTTAQTNELRGAYGHLATKADIAELRGETKTGIESIKTWLLWRVLIGAAIIQGIIAAGIKYLP